MDKRKYFMSAKDYLCVTIDRATICQKAEPFLKKSVKDKDERKNILNNLLKWCETAEIGASVIRDEFTVTVQERDL